MAATTNYYKPNPTAPTDEARTRAERAWELKRLIQEMSERHACEIATLKDSQALEMNTATAELEDLEAALLEEFQTTLGDDERTRALAGTHVELRIRKSAPKWVYEDADAIAWAEANAPEFLRVKTELRKDTLKKWVAVGDDGNAYHPETGEIVPGVVVAPGEDQFQVAYTVVQS